MYIHCQCRSSARENNILVCIILCDLLLELEYWMRVSHGSLYDDGGMEPDDEEMEYAKS